MSSHSLFCFSMYSMMLVIFALSLICEQGSLSCSFISAVPDYTVTKPALTLLIVGYHSPVQVAGSNLPSDWLFVRSILHCNCCLCVETCCMFVCFYREESISRVSNQKGISLQ